MYAALINTRWMNLPIEIHPRRNKVEEGTGRLRFGSWLSAQRSPSGQCGPRHVRVPKSTLHLCEESSCVSNSASFAACTRRDDASVFSLHSDVRKEARIAGDRHFFRHSQRAKQMCMRCVQLIVHHEAAARDERTNERACPNLNLKLHPE